MRKHTLSLWGKGFDDKPLVPCKDLIFKVEGNKIKVIVKENKGLGKIQS